MKKLISISLAACLSIICMAATPPSSRHSVRLGWGDMLFETLAFHPSAPEQYSPSLLPENYRSTRTSDYRYTGHIFGEYMYSLTDVTSVGIQADFEGIFWKEGTYDRNRNAVNGVRNVDNYNLTLLPTVRFTYFRRDWVSLYSGVSVGLLMAFDNQHQFELAPALLLNPIGARFGKGNWGGFVELGGLNALKGANDIYMFASRLVSVGVNYIW